MSIHVGVRGLGHLSRALVGSGAALGPGIVTGVQVLGDISVGVTTPTAQTVPMQTNGTAIRIATTGTAAYTSLDLTKITLTVQDLGWDANGSEVTQTRTVGINGHLYAPYNGASPPPVYQPNLGEFYLKLSNRLYNQDAKWFSLVTAVNFAAGWLTGQPAGKVGAVTRADNKRYDPLSIQAHCPWFQRVATGGKLSAEFACVSRWPRNGSMVACVEAWTTDGTNTGTVVRQATCARSPNTPADSTLQGKPAATYSLQVDPAGLTAGRVEMRWRVKPWIGPPSFGSGGTDSAGTSFPAYGVQIYAVGNYAIPQAFPFCYDTNGSYAPLFGCLIYDPAATPTGFSRLIASNTNVATVDVSGLCATQPGAEASGVYYADLATFLTAVQRLNNSGSALTILSDDGLSTRTLARGTVHNDCSGAVAVCKPVSGSVAGADFGAYSVRVSCSARPVGLTLPEIRSSNGLPSDDVRWRGRNSDGTATGSNAMVRAMRFRGITLDSRGVGPSGSACAVFDSGGAGIPTTAKTETTGVFNDYVDSRRWSTATQSTGFWVHYESGWVWDTRVDVENPQSTGEFNQSHASLAGLVSSIGSNYHVDTTDTGGAVSDWAKFIMPPCLLGAKLQNINIITGGDPNPAVQPKSPIYGGVLHNVHLRQTWSGIVTNVAIGVSVPVTALGINNVLVQMDTASTGTATSVGLTNDDTYAEVAGVNVYGLCVALPNISPLPGTSGANDVTGRLNWFYQDQLEIRLNKDAIDFGCVARNMNTKGDPFSAPAPNPSANTLINPGWSANHAYYKGALVSDAVFPSPGLVATTIYYQVLADIPANSGYPLTDTTHYRRLPSSPSASPNVATGPQPLRQGNGDFRDGVDCGCNVYATTASSPGDPTPSATSWFGRNRGVGSKAGTPVWSNFWNSPSTGDFTPKPGGELVNMVPAGMAWSPIDLNGVTMLNDGTDASGPLQIPH